MPVDSTVSEVEWLARELDRLEGATIAQAVRRALLERPCTAYGEQDYEVRRVEARLAAIASLPAREVDDAEPGAGDARALSKA